MEDLRSNFGDLLLRIEGEKGKVWEWYGYPTLERLSSVTTEELRGMGLGYRDKFYVKTCEVLRGEDSPLGKDLRPKEECLKEIRRKGKKRKRKEKTPKKKKVRVDETGGLTIEEGIMVEMKVPELKNECKIRGLQVGGKKEELVKRLRDFFEGGGDEKGDEAEVKEKVVEGAVQEKEEDEEPSEDLVPATTEEVSKGLMKLVGVGQKVADCIALFGMSSHDTVPCDTHVFQMAARWDEGLKTIQDKAKEEKKAVAIGNKVHEEVGKVFRRMFPGGYAGWAQSVLFCAELPSFKEQMGMGKVKKEREGEGGMKKIAPRQPSDGDAEKEIKSE